MSARNPNRWWLALSLAALFFSALGLGCSIHLVVKASSWLEVALWAVMTAINAWFAVTNLADLLRGRTGGKKRGGCQ